MTLSSSSDSARIVDALAGRRTVVLTGAGVSTESGIPDYRSPQALASNNKCPSDNGEAPPPRVRRPIHGPEFVRSSALRRRYWARAMVGWEKFRLARPGPAHLAIAQLEASGAVTGLITQNVDRLHHQAGSMAVTELHGALAEVICLECGRLEERDPLQARLRTLNPTWIDGPTPMAPDGDADLDDDLVERFVVPGCTECGGALKPNVVFFGHNVAKPIVEEAFERVDEAEVIVIAGTSLAVFSGYRFLLRAVSRQIPIVIINRGPVRGEENATFKIEASTGEVLSAVARQMA